MQFPHCDANILHGPKWGCEYCNAHPDWQELREAWGINFSGEHDPQKSPCPSLRFRSEEIINRWGGNVPTDADGNRLHPTPEHPRKSVFERLRDNLFKGE